jgi:uncharacterized protein
MSIRDRIGTDMTAALRAGDKDRLSVLRMLKARLLEAEVELRRTRGRDAVVDDVTAADTVARYAKQRQDSIEAYRSAGREDLAAREEAELAIVREYLPRALGEDEIRTLVSAAIAESGARSPKDLGPVMKLLQPRVRGIADGAVVSRIAREMLGGASS